MFGNIHIINTESFIKELEAFRCGKTSMPKIESKDFEIKQFETKPLKGFQLPDNFPNCCSNHKDLFRIGIERLAKFPNCCEKHKKLNNAPWFTKENYSYFPDKFVKTLAYTWHCISECIDHENWYKEITDYIEYTANSYGQFPDGYGPGLGIELYINNIALNIESEKGIPDEKKQKLKEFINNFGHYQDNIEEVDINLLISKYKEWLKLFPFEISFFSHLKSDFENQLPLIKEEGKTNIYSGLTGFKLKTKDELLNTLTELTRKIISEINSLTLFKLGLLTHPKQIKLEIILANRNLELNEITMSNSSKKEEYIRILKKWMTGEKTFLKEISPIIKEASIKQAFINDLIDGIKQLQKNDDNAFCISNLKNNGANKEAAFRNWFLDFFTARYPNNITTAEEEKGKGRIDLKIHSKENGDKIIEFKGWWNQTKTKTVEQVCSYLTDFETDGYIVMINHNKNKDISEEYKQIILNDNSGFAQNSWEQHKIKNTDLYYFKSTHKYRIKEKIIYHFIFNAYF